MNSGQNGFTIDAFHRGRFYLAQPSGRGHRAGIDAMILASSVPTSFDRNLADLGAGAGAAGLAVASRCAKARVTLIENNEEMAKFAAQTLQLKQNSKVAANVSICLADIALTGNKRKAAGLADGSFEIAIMNPPFNSEKDRPSPDQLKRAAHVMDEEQFEGWIRTASAILVPGGMLALIARPSSLFTVLSALRGRFGGLQIKPVHSLSGRPAIRMIIRGVKGSRKTLSVVPALTLHEADGRSFTKETEAIINGQASLFGD